MPSHCRSKTLVEVTSRGGKKGLSHSCGGDAAQRRRKRMTLSTSNDHLRLYHDANAIGSFRYWQMFARIQDILNNSTNLQENSSTS